MPPRIGVLASGRGSNFVAIAEAIRRGDLKAEIALLISDRKDAAALAKARELGIAAEHIPYSVKDREAFERAAGDRFDEAGCSLIILAGYMRLLTPYFVRRYPGRILNIHPSLLPSFRGLHAQKQALEFGVKIAGCTVHVVTEELDAGPILGQRAVPVLEDDTEDTLSARILEQEHRLYPEAIGRYLADGVGMGQGSVTAAGRLGQPDEG